MALDATGARSDAATGVITAATHAAVYSTAPTGGAAGTAISGVARQPIAWSSVTDGVATASVTFSGFPNNTTVAGAGLHSALTGGTYKSGGAITQRTMLTGDTLTLALSLTIS